MTNLPLDPGTPTEQATRWQILPAALFVLFGTLTSIGSLALLATFLFGLPRPRIASDSPAQYLFGLVLMTSVGIGVAFTGRCWWRKQWSVAFFCTVVFYALGVFAASQAWPAGSQAWPRMGP
jgi:hypothetical protein